MARQVSRQLHMFTNQMQQTTTSANLCQHVLRSLASLRGCPVDILVWHFDVACLAVNAAIES